MPILVQVRVQPDPLLPATVHLDEAAIQAFLYDISEFGVGLLTNFSLPWGSVVDLELPRASLPLPGHSSPSGLMRINGRVIHSIPQGAQYRLGISFTRMEESDRALIRKMSVAPLPRQDERRRTPRVALYEG